MSWIGLVVVVGLVCLCFITFFTIAAVTSSIQISEDLHAIREKMEGREIDCEESRKVARKMAFCSIGLAAITIIAGIVFLGGIWFNG